MAKGKVFDDGHDVVVLRIETDRSLHPIPGMPRFLSVTDARKYLKNEASHIPSSRVALVRFLGVGQIMPVKRVVSSFSEDPRHVKKE